MKTHCKKLFVGIFMLWFGILASFPPLFASAEAPSCNFFGPASYTIANNAGNSSFLINTPIETNLALRTKGGTAGGDDVDIVLVMDRSGSMRSTESSNSSEKKIDAAKKALNTVIDIVAQTGNLNNRISLVTFSSDATLDQALTNNYNAVKVAVTSMSPGGYTSIGGGLLAAAGEMKAHSKIPNKRRFIVLASDGLHNTSPSIEAGIAAIPSDTTVYTVGIGKDSDPVALQNISSTAGAANGIYFPSKVTDLTEVFQKIVNQILGAFTLSNVSLSFTRDDVTHTDLTTTVPAKDSYDSTNGIIRWNNLGNLVNGQTKNLSLNYSGTRVGSNVPLNTFSLNVGYTVSGTQCTENVPVNVLFVNIVNTVPPLGCADVVWTPSADSMCTTQMFTQTSNCGTTRSAIGTKVCPQCSDGIDNDNDGFIDYPFDRGCYSALDDDEKNYNIRFFQF